jgi:hypothetical protein
MLVVLAVVAPSSNLNESFGRTNSTVVANIGFSANV